MKILEERKSRKRQKALAKDNERHIRELDRERKEFQREKEDAIKQGIKHYERFSFAILFMRCICTLFVFWFER